MPPTQSQVLQLQRAQRAIIPTPVPMPPPLKGWNTRDPWEAMDPQEAITLDNFQPDYGGITLREGCLVYAENGGTAPVTSLMLWRSGSQAELVAASGGQIWLPSSPGSLPLGTGFTSDWWNGAMFNGRLIMANGHDAVQVYNGTTLAALAIAPDPTPPAGSPIYPTFNASTMIGVAVVHNILYLWDGQSPGFWYGNAPYAYTGNILHWFPFDMVTGDNAGLLDVDTLSYDGGQGIASYTIFVCQSGECLLYTGTSPDIPASQAGTGWSLQGFYTLPAPPFAGQRLPRAMARYGGDLYIVTSTDYIKFSQLIAALKEGLVPPRSKATGACMAAVAQGYGLNGWQLVYWGGGRRLVVNVPLIAPDPGANQSNFEQHVYNTGLDAWCRYRGLDSYCWCTWDDKLYFGTANGTVCQFGISGGDELALKLPAWDANKWDVTPWQTQIYNLISAYAQPSWQLFGGAQRKRPAAIRPVVRSSAACTYNFGVGVDYQDTIDTNIVVVHSGSPARWDSTPWGSPWERPAETDSSWYVAGGDGSALTMAIAMTTAIAAPWIWTRTDWRIEPGVAL